MELLKNYIYKQVANHGLTQSEAKQMLLELKEKHPVQDDEIAIIGMSGKFPLAKNLKEYWENIKNGVVCIGSFPKERIQDAEDYLLKFHHQQLVAEDAIKEDGHLDVNYETRGYMYEIDKFDAAFFGISPREAKTMDPDQRQFLEVSYEAMEDGGYGGNKMYGENVGVFVGIDHVSEMKYKKLAGDDAMVVTGTWPGILASRVSYIYNFHGPSIVIDTACSSGLVSVHMACNSLKSGECDMAIAGGLSSFYYRPVKFKDELKELDSVESKDNMVKTFDNNANGTVWGEGVGAVLLKPLSKALEDGDPIHAVIKASAINNDGASNGITAPDAGAQESLLLKVWNKGNINPETIQYIEAHGTGTVLGDPIEIKAMTKAFRSVTDKKQFCGIGSVKPSIGHLVGASGLASLLKVILMLKNKSMPASLNFKEPNSYINFSDSPVYVCDTLREWEMGEMPRRAGINSFGFSGTNCHVVLEEAPLPRQNKESLICEFEIFTISAKSQNALKNMVKCYYEEFLEKELNLQDICFTVNTGRGTYSHRLILLVKNYADLKDKLKYINEIDLTDLNKFGIYYSEHKIVSDNKPVREKGEITEVERRKFTKSATIKLEELIQNYSYPTSAELCDLYVKGAKVEWGSLYKERTRKKLHLPFYPLEKTRFWYEEKKVDVKALINTVNKNTKEIVHPLVDRCLAESMFQDIYVTEFSTDRQWVLSDHKILDNFLIPGTTYIEMAIEVCKKHYGYNVEIKDVIYYSPVIVKENDVREVHSILIKHKDHIELTFASKINSSEIDEEWVKHVECKAYKLSDYAVKVYDVELIRNKLLSEKDESKLIDMSSQGSAIQLGERWQNEKILAVGKSEALVELELPDRIAYDIDQFCLHVSMLDNAVNAVSQKIGKGLYLPFYYKSIKVSGKMQNKFYSYIRINEKMLKGMETITFDVSLMDHEGKVFAEVNDYSLKKVNETEFKMREAAGKNNAYFEIAWLNSELSVNKKELTSGNFLVFKDNKGIGNKMIERLKADGCNVIEVDTGSKFKKVSNDKYIIQGEETDYQSLMADLAGRDLTHIVHLMTLSDSGELRSLSELEEQQKRGVYSLFYLTRALVANKFNKEIELVLISDYVNEVTKNEKLLNPHHASMFGLSKIVTQEHTNLICRCMDIDDNKSIDAMIAEIKSDNIMYKVAYREGKRFVEEFRKLDLEEATDNKFSIKETGVYIISGGTGGLGLEMGKYLASKNKVKIAFINRSKLPERNAWDELISNGENKKLCSTITTIRDIEQTGAEVNNFSANVSSFDEMKQIVDQLKSKYGAINGIIHCAGVAGDGFIMRKGKEIFDSVLLPKIQGTWILDKLTSEENLDFFVMFSSILTIFGDPGQGDYTAANSYMDAFADYRTKKGKRTVSINWPAWKEAGMAVDYGIKESDTTIKPISTGKALRSFEEILCSKSARALPGDINYSRMLERKDDLPFALAKQIEDVLQKQKAKLNTEGKTESQEVNTAKAEIKGRGGQDYNETENTIAQIWSRVLGLNEIDIFDNFSSMGGDSMMAIQLLKQIDTLYKGIVDISDIFSYPSVQQMAEYIDQKRGQKKESKKVKKDKEESISDESLKSLLDGLESGETSIENALKLLDY